MFFWKRKKKEPLQCHDLVLVVEDNEDVINLLEHVLGSRGYCLELARDGHQALELINKLSKPSLVLLDIMVPIHSGFEILRQIRNRAGWENVPVIMLSAREDEDDISKARSLGATDYLLKPFEPRTLLEQVNTLVEQRN